MQDQDSSLTPLSEMGEFGLIKRLTSHFPIIQPGTIKGVGDDAAIISSGENQLVLTTDLLTEGIHFDLIYTPLKHLGYKAVVVNLSDIFAMNATPTHILVSLAISRKFAVEHLDELFSGIKAACEHYGIDMVGGDTNSSLTGLTISITAVGKVAPGKAIYRNGAKMNDLICVSGDLGAAYLGLQVLEREKKIFNDNLGFQPKLDSYEYVLKRQLKPEARKDIPELLASLDVIPTSMIDISDGLSSEILHICEQSGTGCRIYQEKIPVNVETSQVAEEFQLEPVTCALNGGEDYELLFTIPLTDADKVLNRSDISVIGHICDKSEGAYLVTNGGELVEIIAQGWNAMKSF